MSKKRAFVRYTKSGEIVPGSLIITTNGGYPDKSSLWKEVTTNECCDGGGGCITFNFVPLRYSIIKCENPSSISQYLLTFCNNSKPSILTGGSPGEPGYGQPVPDGFYYDQNGTYIYVVENNTIISTDDAGCP